MHSKYAHLTSEKNGDMLSLFLTRFESRGVHGRGEQWNARDTRVYIGLGLREDNNPTFYVRHWYYDYGLRPPLPLLL
jgi:hypothetical protein